MKSIFILVSAIIIVAVFAGLYRLYTRQFTNAHQQPLVKKESKKGRTEIRVMSDGLVSTHLLW